MAGKMVLVAAALFLLAAPTSASEVTPLGKVTQMLNEMAAKGKAEKHDEEVEFAKFQQWCDSTRGELTKNIAGGADQIVQLTADIAKAEADAETLAAEIADLEASVAKQTQELNAATAVRKTENTDYKAAHKDFSESIDAIERATSVLKARGADVKQSSLLQLSNSAALPAQAKAVISSFLSSGTSDLSDEAAPEANAYENQSGGVIGLLEKLRHKIEDQRLTLEKAEMASKGNFEVLKQQLDDNIKDANSDIDGKTATKAKRIGQAATGKGDLEATTAAKAEDEKALDDTNASCHARSDEFEKNQVVRAGEVTAIEKALEILNSDEVKGAAGKHLPALAQTALAQLRAQVEESPSVRAKLAAFLQANAKKLGSRYLSVMAIRAQEDPFAKIKKMIKDMIVKLMEEANGEADAKAYCDTELATNKMTRDNKASEVEELTANIEEHTAVSAKLVEEVTVLSDQIAEIARQQAEATNIRNEEKAVNTVTIADAKAGQQAVSMAIKVLKEFYASVASAALLQGGEEAGIKQEMSQAAKAPYKGMQSEGGGVMGFLDVCLSDFARLETETSASEDSNQSEFDTFINESTQDKEVKETEMEHKSEKRQQTDAENLNLKKNLELTQKELDEALGYFEKLKPDCLDQGFSYEDRVKAREEEIEALKEALKILAGEDLA